METPNRENAVRESPASRLFDPEERPAARIVGSARKPRGFRLLQLGFVAAPILAGVDKFFNRMTDWERYLAPQVARRVDARRFMRAVGAVEIAAGGLVLIKPRLGGWVVAAWLAGIIGNLLAGEDNYDVALRDLGLAIGAVTLARMSRQSR